MKTLILFALTLSLLSCHNKKDDPKPGASGSSQPTVYGCMDPAARNYNSQATSNKCACACTYSVPQ